MVGRARVDESATLDDVMAILRPTLNGGVKAEEDEEEQAARGPNTTQLTILKQLASDGWKYDPSHGGDALRNSRHLLTEIGVDRLRHTHQTISSTFRLGDHCGMPVMELTKKLLDGRVTEREIVPLVVVKIGVKYWVVHGNRRLKALKEFHRQSSRKVYARCILYDTRSKEGVPHSVLAKLLLHASTQTEGRSAEFGGPPRQVIPAARRQQR